MSILILTNAKDEHLPWITKRLEARGEHYVTLDPASFPSSAAATVSYSREALDRRVLTLDDATIELDDVSAVWLRRPGTPNDAIAADAPNARWLIDTWSEFLHGLWATLECLWLPGTVAAQAAAGLKVSQLALAARVGFRIPRTVTTSDPSAVLAFYDLCGGRIIAKAAVPRLLTGRDGERRDPFTRPVRRRDLATCRALRHAPVTFQENVVKRVELRVTVVGDRAFAAEIDSQASSRTRHDWRHYDHERVRYSQHELPRSVERLCVQLTRALGLCFGAIDLILTPEGEYVFLEINPNGQWAWVEELTHMPIADAIVDLLIRGRERNMITHWRAADVVAI